MSVLHRSDMFYIHSDLSSSPTSYGWGGSFHKRSCSVLLMMLVWVLRTQILVWEPCLYFARGVLERNDFSLNSPTGEISSASRQIYLTFLADSTFREEDVSNYFRFGFFLSKHNYSL